MVNYNLGISMSQARVSIFPLMLTWPRSTLQISNFIWASSGVNHVPNSVVPDNLKVMNALITLQYSTKFNF